MKQVFPQLSRIASKVGYTFQNKSDKGTKQNKVFRTKATKGQRKPKFLLLSLFLLLLLF
jgi:hypothetical protein